MSEKQWYICISENVFGPLASKAVQTMLQQYRLQLLDFAWCSEMEKWTRISDISEFAGAVPAYPQAPIPKRASGAATVRPPAPKPVSKSDSGAEKIRSTDRFAVLGKACMDGGDRLMIADLSSGGIFVVCAKPPPVGTDVKFQLEISGLDHALEMTGVVVRHGVSAKKSGFAIEFTRANPAHLRTLTEFIVANKLGKAG